MEISGLKAGLTLPGPFLPPTGPGDLPDPGIEPRSPSLQAVALTSEPPGKPRISLLSLPIRGQTE